jgi:hypothetical protein
MDAPVLAALLGIVGGLASGAVAAWVGLRGKRLDHEVERDKLWVTAYEKTLFESRLPDYRALWALTEQTSRRKIDSLSKAAADELAEELTLWYYRQGGILLTGAARNAYFRARESLDDYDPKQPSKVVRTFSSLRTALCEDLNSRKGPTLQRPDASGRDDEDYPEVMFSRAPKSRP